MRNMRFLSFLEYLPNQTHFKCKKAKQRKEKSLFNVYGFGCCDCKKSGRVEVVNLSLADSGHCHSHSTASKNTFNSHFNQKEKNVIWVQIYYAFLVF